MDRVSMDSQGKRSDTPGDESEGLIAPVTDSVAVPPTPEADPVDKASTTSVPPAREENPSVATARGGKSSGKRRSKDPDDDLYYDSFVGDDVKEAAAKDSSAAARAAASGATGPGAAPVDPKDVPKPDRRPPSVPRTRRTSRRRAARAGRTGRNGSWHPAYPDRKPPRPPVEERSLPLEEVKNTVLIPLTFGSSAAVDINVAFGREAILLLKDEERKKLIHQFHEITGNSERMSRAQFRQAVGNPSEYVGNHFKEYADVVLLEEEAFNEMAGRDGYIHLTEFLAVIAIHLYGEPEDVLKWYFRVYDTNNNGVLEKDEVLRMVKMFVDVRLAHSVGRKNLGDTEELAASICRRIWKEADPNHDGEIEFKDFLVWGIHWLELARWMLRLINVIDESYETDATCLPDFSDDELHALKSEFKKHADPKTGGLSREQFRAVLEGVGLPHQFPVDRFFDVIDQKMGNGDGTVQFEEMKAMYSQYLRGATDNKIQFTAQLFDVKGKGYIDKGDMYNMLRSFYDNEHRHRPKQQRPALTRKTSSKILLNDGSVVEMKVDASDAHVFVDRFFYEADHDHDDKLSYDEFYDFVSYVVNFAPAIRYVLAATHREYRQTQQKRSAKLKTTWSMMFLAWMAMFAYGAGYWAWPGILFPALVDELNISSFENGLMYTVPSLIGVVVIPGGGIMTGRIGPYYTLMVTGAIGLTAYIAVAYGWSVRNSDPLAFWYMLAGRCATIGFELVPIACSSVYTHFGSTDKFGLFFALGTTISSLSNIGSRLVIPRMNLDVFFNYYLPIEAAIILLMAVFLKLLDSWLLHRKNAADAGSQKSLLSVLSLAFYHFPMQLSDVKHLGAKFWVLVGATFCTGMLVTYWGFMTFVLERRFGYELADANTIALVPAFTGMVFGPAIGDFLRRWGKRSIICMVGLLLGYPYFILMHVGNVDPAILIWLYATMITILSIVLYAMVPEVLPDKLQSTGFGLVLAGYTAGDVLSFPVVTLLYDMSTAGTEQGRFFLPHIFMMGVTTLTLLLVMLIYYMDRKTGHRLDRTPHIRELFELGRFFYPMGGRSQNHA